MGLSLLLEFGRSSAGVLAKPLGLGEPLSSKTRLGLAAWVLGWGLVVAASPVIASPEDKTYPMRPQAVNAVSPAAPSSLQLTVVDAVIGILSHTRWPKGKAEPLQLCVNELSSSVLELRGLHDRVPPGRLLPVRLVKVYEPIPSDCAAVYLGAGPATQEALARLNGKPVLTIGEGADSCTGGSLFCLVPKPGGQLRLEVNLDAVARSGLHVHPQVLKIGA
jgi:YfiR/HmsC-like